MGPWVLGSAVTLVVSRLVALQVLRWRYRRGQDGKRVLLLGSEDQVQRVVAHFAASPQFGIRMAGWVSSDDEVVSSDKTGVEHLGDISELSMVVHEEEVDSVMVCGGIADNEVLGRVLFELRTQPVQIYMAPDMSSYSLFKAQVVDYGGQVLIISPARRCRDRRSF